MNNFVEFHEHIERLKNNEDYIDFFIQFSIAESRNNPTYVKELLEYLMSLCKDLNFNTAYSWCSLRYGWIYHDMGELKKAIKYHQKAYNYFSNNHINSGLMSACNALLADYSTMGIFDLAIEYGLEGMDIAEAEKNSKIHMAISLNTAVSYIEIKQYTQALDILERLQITQHNLGDDAIILIDSSMAEVFLKLNELDKTFFYCDKALTIIKKINADFYYGEILRIRAMANYICGNHREGEADFKNALENTLKYNNIQTYIKAMLNWGKCHYSIGKYDSAEEKLLMTITKSKLHNINTMIYDAYTELSNVYSAKQNYKKAFETVKMQNEYEQVIFNSKSNIWFAKINDKNVSKEAEEYKHLYNQIESLSIIGKKIASELKIEKVLEATYQEINKLLPADVFGVALYKEEEDSLDYKVFIQDGKKVNPGIYSLTPKENSYDFGPTCFLTKKDISINDIDDYYKTTGKKPPLSQDKKAPRAKSVIFCPLLIENKAIGILSVQSYRKNSYEPTDLNKLKILASYIAIALENAKLFNEVKYLAKHDGLTGILNHKSIVDFSEGYIKTSLKNGDATGILMIDIDHFKNINDTYGHLSGDYILKTIAKIIKTDIRDYDFVGRYGGEEFLVLLSKVDKKEATEIGERIRNSIANYTFKVDNYTIKTTISLGLYIIDNPTCTLNKAIQKADKALYLSKNSGRNQLIEFHDIP